MQGLLFITVHYNIAFFKKINDAKESYNIY